MVLRRAALAALLVLGSLPARAATPRLVEDLSYRWRLDGFLGVLVGLFFPNDGEGRLTLERVGEGRFRGELQVTAEKEAKDDFFRYGAEWELPSGRTLKAWSKQHWRGESKSKEADLPEEGVIDVATAIFALRRDPPRVARRLEIWSDGKLYPVLVEPRETESRLLEGRPVHVRHYSIRGERLPDRKVWKGELDLWLADDPEATPVEILVVKKAARVHLELLRREELPGTGTSATAAPPG